jgi:hypothetical protein
VHALQEKNTEKGKKCEDTLPIVQFRNVYVARSLFRLQHFLDITCLKRKIPHRFHITSSPGKTGSAIEPLGSLA